MGILVVVAGALFALLLAPAAYASRSYPTGEEADQKLHAIINNETNSIRGLIDHVSPHHDKASDANIIYVSSSSYVLFLIHFLLPHGFLVFNLRQSCSCLILAIIYVQPDLSWLSVHSAVCDGCA